MSCTRLSHFQQPANPLTCAAKYDLHAAAYPIESVSFRGVAQPGSAPQWGCGGRRFKSSRPDQLLNSPISTYETTGGLPENGKFSVRGNIEEWVRRDLEYTGMSTEEIARLGYFDAYLRYWEQYHYYVATTGLSTNKLTRIVPYSNEAMMDTALDYRYRFGNRNPKPEEF